ncbi:MAG TPA: hypothetical protein VKK79_13545 [Candidatus Lokiarchaeia archaeon]|nr:hypothetical protein [Candidatus Lokiarchaeia archaeon]
MAKRLLYLDYMRGLFIGYLIFIHGIAQIVLDQVSSVMGQIPDWANYVLAPFVILATWAPLFALVSGTANTYSLQSQFLKNMKEAAGISDVNLWKLLKGQFLNSFFMYLLSLLNMGVFSYPIGIGGGPVRYTLITGSIARGYLSWGDPLLLFFSDALALIAISGFVTGILCYIIWRKGGVLKVKRNIVFLTVVAVVWVAVSPALQDWLEPVFLNSLNSGNYFLAFVLKFIVGPSEITFPNVAFAIFGQVFGIALALEMPYKYIRNYGYTFGVFFTVLAVIFYQVFPVPPLSPSQIGKNITFQNALLNLGLIITIATFLIGFMEYQTPERRAKIAKQTIAIRRFGIVALTVFILEGLVSISWKKLYMAMVPFVDFTTINIPATLVYLGVLLLFWYFIAKLWEKYNFKYSFEWVLVQIVGRLRGRMSNRLNVREVLYNIEGEPKPVEKKSVEENAEAENFVEDNTEDENP